MNSTNWKDVYDEHYQLDEEEELSPTIYPYKIGNKYYVSLSEVAIDVGLSESYVCDMLNGKKKNYLNIERT